MEKDIKVCTFKIFNLYLFDIQTNIDKNNLLKLKIKKCRNFL